MHVEEKDVLGTKSVHLTKCNAILQTPLNWAASETTSEGAAADVLQPPVE